MKNNYFFDQKTNTLRVTKAFLKAAGNLYTPEYRIFMAYRNDHPGMIISTGEDRKGQSRISYAQMKEYITVRDKSGKMLEQFETVKVLAKIQPSPYNYVKCWFAETFPQYAENVKTGEDGKLRYTKSQAEVILTPAAQEAAPGTVAVPHPQMMEAPKNEDAAEVENQVEDAA